jgi:hypothetical protein
VSDLIPPGVLDDRDVRAAQAVIDAWNEDRRDEYNGQPTPTRSLLRLRGILAAQFADVRAAGVIEGHQAGLVRGHREHAQDLLEALVDRGLLP